MTGYVVRIVVSKRTIIDEIDVYIERECKCRYVRFKDYNGGSVDKKTFFMTKYVLN